MKKILICGSFHGNNLGDVGILDTIIGQLSKNYELTVTSKSPKSLNRVLKTSKNTKVIKITNLFSLFKSIKNTDIVEIGGGGLFFDYSFLDTISIIGKSQLIVWVFITIVSRIFRKKVFWLGIGVGEFSSFGKIIFRLGLLFVSHVEVRDKSSLERLINDFDYKKAQKSADWVYLAKNIEEVRRHHDSKQNGSSKIRLGIVLKQRDGIEKNALDFVKNINIEFTDVEITLIATNPDKDNELHKNIANDLNLHFIDSSVLDYQEFIYTLGSFDYLVSMRMHALLLGFQKGVMGIGISSEKASNNSKYLNKVEQIQEELYGKLISSKNLDFEKVKEEIEYILSKSKELREKALINYEKMAKLSENNLKVIKDM